MSYLELAKRLHAELKASRAEPDIPTIPAEPDDPLLTIEHWYPEFHRLHRSVVHETRDFDYAWVRQNQPSLYREIKLKEQQIDHLHECRMSAVMDLIRDWRGLILRAYTVQRTKEAA